VYNQSLADYLSNIPSAGVEVYAAVLMLLVIGVVTGQETRLLLAGLIAVTLAPNPGSLVAVALLGLVVKGLSFLREVFV